MASPLDSVLSVIFAGRRTLFFGRVGEQVDAVSHSRFATMLPAFNEAERQAAEKAVLALVQMGCVELCCVGPEAEQLEDAIDSILEDAGAFEVVTTSEADLVQGIEYFLFAAAGAPTFLLALVSSHPTLVRALLRTVDDAARPEDAEAHPLAQELRAKGLVLHGFTLTVGPPFADLVWDALPRSEFMRLPPALVIDPRTNERRLVLETIRSEIRYYLCTYRDPHTQHEVEHELGVLATADAMLELVTEFLVDEVPAALLRTPRFSSGRKLGRQPA